MQAYIRKRSDFTASLLHVLSYDTTLQSIHNDTSTIVAKYKDGIDHGDFVICDEYRGVVKSISVTGNIMSLNCTDIDSVFDRPLYFQPDTSISTIESFIHTQAMLHYRHCDSMYALDYLTVETPSTSTSFVKPLSNKDMFTLSDYIKLARRYGVMVDYDLKGTKLVIEFKPKPSTVHKYDFTAHTGVVSEIYGGHTVAKVTNYQMGVATDYYLLSDGTVTNDSNHANRLYGAWEVLNEATQEQVLQRFAVSYGHEIEFLSSASIPFLSSVELKMPSGYVLRSFISSVKKKSGSELYRYTAGELQTTLTAKLRR